MPDRTYVITGATGHVGAGLAHGLLAAGLSASVAGPFVEMGQSISAGNMNPTAARTAANTTRVVL